MPRLRFVFPVAAVVLCASVSVCRAEQTLTYPDLVNRMTDLSRLSVLPVAGRDMRPGVELRPRQQVRREDRQVRRTGTPTATTTASSAARASRVVMAEIEGPGLHLADLVGRGAARAACRSTSTARKRRPSICRSRTTSPATRPRSTIPMLSYDLDKLGCQGQEPLHADSRSRSRARSWPTKVGAPTTISPTARSRRTRRCPRSAPALATENAAALQKVNDFFKDKLGEDPAGKREGQETLTKNVTVEPGETAVVAKLDGPQAITALKVKMSFADRKDQMAGLRKLVLRITWDGQDKPAVWCPLGDFFGTAPGENLYKTLMTGMTKDGYYSYWYMPFGKSAVVELVNEDKVARTADVEVDARAAGTFVRRPGPLPRQVAPRHGRVVEGSLARLGHASDARPRAVSAASMLHVWNPRGGWWGEGDEKFFVDGEKFPSTFGTGSEDYFGYAWCDPGLFQRPYHAQTMTQQNKGHQSVLALARRRQHPLRQVVRGRHREVRSSRPRREATPTRSSGICRPTASIPTSPVPAADRDDYYDVPPVVVNGIRMLEVDGRIGGRRKTCAVSRKGKWQNNEQMWWTGAKPGDKLKLRLPGQGRRQVSRRAFR